MKSNVLQFSRRRRAIEEAVLEAKARAAAETKSQRQRRRIVLSVALYPTADFDDARTLGAVRFALGNSGYAFIQKAETRFAIRSDHSPIPQRKEDHEGS